ncbi:MAG: type II toxin-antitoxin system VapC family toxin [Steroidobacteraceae bacterium]
MVLDSSATLAWVLDDERENALDSLELLYFERATVPQHWILEVTNVLRLAIRRQRLKSGELPAILERIRILPLQVDAETASRGWDDTLALAERFALTTYDAAYLELAIRLNAPLATLDQDLARAARAAGVPLLI